MTSRQRNFNIKSKERGITLITLVITIIVLLILAGVTLSGIFDKGIIKNTKNAKENAEILEEKETIQMAILFAKQASQTGDITLSDIENAMKRVVDGSRAAVVEDTDYTYIRFNDSNRHYTINNAEEIAGPVEIEGVPNAGDLTKGGKQNGTEEKPYIINCIEDLVAFSIMSNGGKEESTFTNKYVILARTLNFKAVSSYNDYSTKEYGDLNGDGTVEDIKTELTKQGDTCKGFTPIASFKGTFDGQNNKICNLYENRGTSNAGLFASSSGTIQNLGLKNITIIGGNCIGGIVASSSGKVINCFVEGTSIITGTGNIGLISGSSSNIISKCYSIGELKLNNITSGNFGGIVGNNTNIVEKSYNIMDIEGGYATGGIVGNHWGGTIEQCYHIGNIDGKWKSGGIAGDTTAWKMDIINCYNIGNIMAGENAGGIVAYSGSWCFNCYNIGIPKNAAIIGGQDGGKRAIHCFARSEDGKAIGGIDQFACESLSDNEFKQEGLITELNNLIYIDSEGTLTETARDVWKKDENNINNGYPIFIWQEETENTD